MARFRSRRLVGLALVAVVGLAPWPARAQPFVPFVPAVQGPAYPYNVPSLGLIEQATFSLFDRYFEPIDSAALFQAAAAAAEEELARQGVVVKLRAVVYTGAARSDWESFAAAYAGVALAYPDTIDQQALAHSVIRSMTRTLNDCHTFFMAASGNGNDEQRQRVQGEVGGQGIGISVQFGVDGYPVVEEAFRNAPAHMAGVQSGDRILAVGGQDVAGFTSTRLSALLREPVGQPVVLTVARPGAATFDLSVTRSRYTAPVIDSRMLDGGVGYVRVYGFSPRLDQRAIQQAYIDLAGQGATGFVVDMRGNPGGSGQAAVSLLSALVGRDLILFSNVSRDGLVTPMVSTEDRWPLQPKVALLVNGRSYSSSEIVAAVAQDFAAARVFGTATRGCVASVEMQPLFDGSTLGITTAKVITAKGRSLNRVGVTPDVEVDRTVDDLAHGEDPPLARAVGWLRSRAE